MRDALDGSNKNLLCARIEIALERLREILPRIRMVINSAQTVNELNKLREEVLGPYVGQYQYYKRMMGLVVKVDMKKYVYPPRK